MVHSDELVGGLDMTRSSQKICALRKQYRLRTAEYLRYDLVMFNHEQLRAAFGDNKLSDADILALSETCNSIAQLFLEYRGQVEREEVQVPNREGQIATND